MGQEILEALYQQYLVTQDPIWAVRFLTYYGQNQEMASKPATAKRLKMDEWLHLALAQEWSDPQGIINSVLSQNLPFKYGYQCPCGDVFLDSEIIPITNFDDWDESIGKSCTVCGAVSGCGQCNLLISVRLRMEGTGNWCHRCFLARAVEALETGSFPDRDASDVA